MGNPLARPVRILKSGYHDLKLRTKLFLFAAFACILPLTGISIVLDRSMSAFVREELGRSWVQIAKQYADKTGYKLALYKNILVSLSSNGSVMDLLKGLEYNDGTNPYETALRISRDIGVILGTRSLNEVKNLMLFTDRSLREVYGPKVSSERLVAGQAWYRDMVASGAYDYYHLQRFPWQSARTGTYILFANPVIASETMQAKRRGFVKLDVDTGLLFGTAAGQETGAGVTILVTGRAGELLYGDSALYASLFPQGAASLTAETAQPYPQGVPTEVRRDGRPSFLVPMAISQYDWRAWLLFDGRELERRTSEVRRSIYLLALLALALIAVLSYGIASSLSTRIRSLIHKMEAVEGGDLAPRPPLGGRDEIGILDGHFNRMVRRLAQLIRNRYVLELEKREAERSALQAQINPHFLYNTLETISSLAATKGAMEVCDLIHRLGVMFRYNIDPVDHGLVRLQQELDHAANYVRIQQARRGDRFELYLNADADAVRCKVQKFILQPIVENAILHGFQDLPGMHAIEISASVDDGWLRLVVRDDGRGIAPDALAALNRSLEAVTNPQPESEGLTDAEAGRQEDRADTRQTGAQPPTVHSGIGILNVHRRLRLAYGDACGLHIESSERQGTAVFYTMPALEGTGTDPAVSALPAITGTTIDGKGAHDDPASAD